MEEKTQYICSCSFGKDSLAMLLRLIEEGWPLDEVIFYDTGMEFDAIYRIRDKVVKMLASKGIRFTELKPSNDFMYQMFGKPIVGRKNKKVHYGYQWCGGPCRWGTSEKIASLERHCKQYKSFVEYVGLAYDEVSRLNKTRTHMKIYPLAEWRMTERDCLRYCYDHGFSWDENGIDLYSILDRVSCYCCCNKNLKELANIYQLLPDYWQRLRELQSYSTRPMKGEGKSVFELEERFQKQLFERRP